MHDLDRMYQGRLIDRQPARLSIVTPLPVTHRHVTALALIAVGCLAGAVGVIIGWLVR
jgi:hypothetical protein